MTTREIAHLRTPTVASGWEDVVRVIRSLYATAPGWRFRVTVRRGGEVVLDVWAGNELESGLTPLASVSKGVAGIAVAALVRNGTLDLERPMAHYWPEFAAGGKAALTVGDVLAHRAGLLSFPPTMTWEEVIGGQGASALAAATPLWARSSGHGYHAFTIGTLVEELVRRVEGASTEQVLKGAATDSSVASLSFRLPVESASRVLTVTDTTQPSVSGAAPVGDLFAEAIRPFDLVTDSAHWLNSNMLQTSGVPSVSLVGTAPALAAVYASALELPTATRDAVSQLRSSGTDLVLGGHTRFAALFQKPHSGLDFGTHAAFGHDGAGGSLAFADPRTGVAFGYVTTTIPSPARADERALSIARAIRSKVLSGQDV